MNTNQNFQFARLSLGACYYPEHWDRSLWKSDLERMLENGIETIRIGEFAWSKFEPTKGEYTFEFFDDFMNVVSQTDMKVIFCTPTATPPAWLTHEYPEVLNARQDGVLLRHGMRRHYNYNSATYRKFTEIIVDKIASRYAPHKSVVGWQIDNEFNCGTDLFYSESDTVAFRQFLKNRYKTLDALNDAWGTAFWNEEYTRWDQIYVPRVTPGGGANPHLSLDYLRFISYSTLDYCRLQSLIIRKYIKPGDFITTNGIFDNMDNHKMLRESLDIYTYDSYPDFAYGSPSDGSDLRDRKWSRNLTEVRSICPHFGIMEQQAGFNGWIGARSAPAPKPGQLTLWALQSIAHGADYVSFFRWRTCAFGNEIYWQGLLPWSNRDNRVLDEARALSKKIKLIGKVVGSEFVPAFGVLRDYDNRWDAKVDYAHCEIEHISYDGIFRASQLHHAPMDYIYPDSDGQWKNLESYKLLFYPHPYILTESTAQRLKEYVENGGFLVIGCRAGMKDENGKCPMRPLPGLLGELCGADVYEYTQIGELDAPINLRFLDREIECRSFTDLIKPQGNAKPLANYVNGYYKGVCAMTEKSLGKGRVIYLGSAFSEEMAGAIIEYAGAAEYFADDIKPEPSLELVARKNSDGDIYYFTLNYTDKPASVRLETEMTEAFSGETLKGDDVLNAYEVKAFIKKR